jgi:hypothetical protein
MLVSCLGRKPGLPRPEDNNFLMILNLFRVLSPSLQIPISFTKRLLLSLTAHKAIQKTFRPHTFLSPKHKSVIFCVQILKDAKSPFLALNSIYIFAFTISSLRQGLNGCLWWIYIYICLVAAEWANDLRLLEGFGMIWIIQDPVVIVPFEEGPWLKTSLYHMGK